MPVLKNAKQELFVQNYIGGMGVYDAYLAAGYEGSPQAAALVHGNAKVKARISELLERRLIKEEKATERAIQKLALSKEYVISRLMENVERSMQIIPPTKDGGSFKYDGAVANRALELLGKELGMFVDRKEVGAPGEFADLDADGLRKALVERLTMVRQSDGSFGVPGSEGSGGD